MIDYLIVLGSVFAAILMVVYFVFRSKLRARYPWFKKAVCGPADIESGIEEHGGRVTSVVEVSNEAGQRRIKTIRIYRLQDFTDRTLLDGLRGSTSSWEYFSPTRIWGGVCSLIFIGGLMMVVVPVGLSLIVGWWKAVAYPVTGFALFGLIIMGASELEMWLWPKLTLVYRTHANLSKHSAPDGHVLINQSENTNGNMTFETLECLDAIDWPKIEDSTPTMPPLTALGGMLESWFGKFLMLGMCLVAGAILIGISSFIIGSFSLNTFLLVVTIVLLMSVLSRMK